MWMRYCDNVSAPNGQGFGAPCDSNANRKVSGNENTARTDEFDSNVWEMVRVVDKTFQCNTAAGDVIEPDQKEGSRGRPGSGRPGAFEVVSQYVSVVRRERGY